MADGDAAGELDLVKSMAEAWGLHLDDDRARQLAAALARFRAQVATLDQLDLEEHEPGVADPAAGR